jgi:hypothetical protein
MATRGSGSRGRLLAFRIVGWALGLFSILPSLFFILASIVSSDQADRIHRFHNLGGFAGLGLIGVFSIVFVFRPDWTAAYHVLVAQTAAWLIGGLMGRDLISGFYVTAVVGLVVLTALHPDPRSLLRLPGRPSIAMLTYALLAAIPAWIYAVTMAELQLGPASDPHVQMHHWSGVAVAAVLFGLAGLVFSRYAGAPASGWSWLAVAAGIGFWLLTTVEASREAGPA